MARALMLGTVVAMLTAGAVHNNDNTITLTLDPPSPTGDAWVDVTVAALGLDWPLGLAQHEAASVAELPASATLAVLPDPEPPPPPVEVPPPPPVVVYDARGQALDELRVLGAVQWQLNVFDCIGARESGWQSKRSNKMNSNGTFDHGVFQINDVHWPTLNRLGLDPYNPRDAARYAWRLSGQGNYFTAWAVHASCGV